jgi:hypothetical protein
MSTSEPARDRGAALVIAIAFVVMIGAIGAGLAGMVTSSANNRVTLQVLRNREYAADGAIQAAIAEVRGLARDAAASCSTTAGTSSSTVNGMVMHVDWAAACTVVRSSDGTVVSQRNIVFTACESTGAPCAPGAVVIRAQVNFRDDPSGLVTGTAVQSWSVGA